MSKLICNINKIHLIDCKKPRKCFTAHWWNKDSDLNTLSKRRPPPACSEIRASAHSGYTATCEAAGAAARTAPSPAGGLSGRPEAPTHSHPSARGLGRAPPHSSDSLTPLGASAAGPARERPFTHTRVSAPSVPASREKRTLRWQRELGPGLS